MKRERRTLLHEHLQDHDINVPPAGVQVQVAIVFFRIVSVDILTSQLVLNVWLRCLWEDPRLSWDTSTWNMSDTVMIADTDSLENSLIWTPDIELYNAARSVKDTLGVKKISVTSDGSWFSGHGQEPSKYSATSRGSPVSLSTDSHAGWNSERGHCTGAFRTSSCDPAMAVCRGPPKGETTDGSFQEYTIQNVAPIRKVIYFNTPGQSHWPVLVYTATLSRDTGFHVWKLIVPHVSLAVLSFIPY